MSAWTSSPRLIAPGLLTGFGQQVPVPSASPMWIYVRRRFQVFLENLKITADQAEDGETKHMGVVACLNRAYWNHSGETANRVLIGSWGKQTRVRPPRDIDILFILPVEDYWRFQQRTGNRQSQLLQEMRDVLGQTYSATNIRGDGQVIVIPFNTYKIEVAAAFPREGGGFLICDTNDGGRYKHVDPIAEIAALDAADRRRLAGASVGVLLSKSIQLSGDVYLAMMSRGYRGEVYTLDDFTLRGRDWAALAGFLGTAALAFWLGQ